MTRLLVPAPHSYAAVLGTGAYRPARVVTTEDVVARLDTTAQWVLERTGIQRRHRAEGPSTDGPEGVPQMAAAAGAKALADAGVAPADVDLVVVATCTVPFPVPHAAAKTAELVGAGPVGAVDVSAGCAGFCYALAQAADAVRAGSARYVLVAGSERLSDWVDPDDRGTAPIFGDGAGAVVVGPSEVPGIGPVVRGSDGSRSGLIAQAAGGRRVLAMDGPAVFRWATTSLAPVAREACEAAGVAPEDLGGVVLHQANLRIVDAVVRALRLPDTVAVSRDVVDSGNTSAASVPLALDRLRADGSVRPGDPVLLLGFGAGLAYAGQVVLAP